MCRSLVISQLISITIHFKRDFKFFVSYITISSLQTFSTLVTFKHFSTKKKTHKSENKPSMNQFTHLNPFFLVSSTPTSFSSDELHFSSSGTWTVCWSHSPRASFHICPHQPLDQMNPRWSVQILLEQTPHAVHCPKHILKNQSIRS